NGKTWNHISGPEAIEKVKRIAFGLAALGVSAGDRVAIISENRPEWSLIDLAVLSLRAVTVPIYTTQAVGQIRFILENSGSKLLCISGSKLFKHAQEAIQSVEQLEKLIFFDADGIPENNIRSLSLADVEAAGEDLEKTNPDLIEELLSKIEPKDLATIIY